MRRYIISAAVIACFVLLSFLAVESMGVSLLTDPTVQMEKGVIWAAVIGGGLLIADVFIPVPSSVVMIAHGAILGILPGFLVSLVASMGGAMLGWWVGRNCQSWVLRQVPEVEQARAQRLFERHGIVAIVLSRMLPIVSETISIMSGLSGMGWKPVLLASALGSVPPALIYAIAGAVSTNFATGSAVAGLVFGIAALSWWISRKLGQSETESIQD